MTFILLSSLLKSQVVTISAESEKFANILTSKTMVVLVGDEKFDNAVKKAVEKYWKVTPYEFIEMNKIDEYISDKSKTFLLPFVVTVTYTHSAGSGFSDYSKIKSWYSLLIGGRSKLTNYSDNDALVISPFNYYGDERSFVKCAYRMDYMVKGINDAINRSKEKNLTGSGPKVIFKSIDEINKGTVAAISKKTLVINKDVICWFNNKPFISGKLFEGAKYNFKYKLVSDSEFKSIMAGNSSEYLCYFPSIEVNKHILIFDPSTKSTVYYGWQMQGLKIKKKDIKSMMEGKS